ncbi:hypothetical protein A8C32_13395 [Flavivirga aquatica]|uniref:Lipoprotein n=1 Tax=Flavivirga aquatica TaxID=1849968 RepID=A0A1E5TEB1_9FLAO|nr:hypothetical protein [Flavivirga aquatica]OEK09690.1 hypothetical protein A8C32_13395 [Flavivirga aquatica]
MKKFMFAALAIGVLGFTSCKKDDDGDEGDNGNGEVVELVCKTCEVQSISSKYCENEDGTVTQTVGGQSASVDLGGLSFGEFISLIEITGSCK